MYAPNANKERVPDYILRERRRNRLRAARLAVVCTIVILLTIFFALLPYRSLLPALSIPEPQEGEIRLHFLSVGQGDAIVVESGKECILVDGGNGDFSTVNHVVRYIRGLHAEKITYVVTHAERDHCGGMAEIVDSLGADKIYLPILPSYDDPYTELLRVAQQRSIPTEVLVRGTEIPIAGMRAVCLSPFQEGETDENDASSVLYLEGNGVRALLGADISSQREAELMRLAKEGALGDVALDRIDILKVSHHGSASSSAADWLAYLGVRIAVISCGTGNIYGHPSAEALDRLIAQGAQIYRTDELGDIIVTIAQSEFSVQARG